MRFAARTILAIAALMTAGTVTACSSDLTLPSDPGAGGPTDGSAVASIDSAVGSGGSARIEIKLVPGSLVASEVHLEADDNEEKIVSTVSAIDPGSGTVTLDLGGLTVAYGAGTRFRTDEESHESRTAWETAVRGQLEAGRRPLIEARRNPSGEPQSPSDPTFVAADLRLENDSHEPKIEIFVDGDNLQGGSGTSAVLRVLGLDIQVDGRTETGGPGTGGSSVEFEMTVTSVDVGAGVLTLSNGTQVLVSGATAISGEGDLFTLAATADAVTLGRPVRAEGRGAVQSAGPPRVIAASSIKIEVDD